MARPAVIVINSQVARGGVGGRAATFALERLGFPVWIAPTVLLSWHPGHGDATRIITEPGAFASLLGDLAASPHLGAAGGLLTGYFGDPNQVGAAAALVAALKAANPGALYLCDPVLGDESGLYLPKATLAAIRDRLLPLADIATPNRFELGFLLDRQFSGNDALADAARRLGVREAVVTSAFAPQAETANLLATGGEAWLATHAALRRAPHGTGDLFAALYLAARLQGAAPADALRTASAGTLGLVQAAAATDADELPLAVAGDALLAAPSGVRIERLRRR